MQQSQRGEKRAIEVLEEQGLAVQRVDGDVLSAVGVDEITGDRGTRKRRERQTI